MATVGRAEVRIVADARGFSLDAERAIRRELSNVRVRDRDSNAIRNGLVQGAVAAGTAAGASAGAAWIKQFGIVLQGGISAKAAGALGTAVLGALGPALLIAGTLLGGILITAMGSALTAIPIVVAAQSPKVQKAFTDMAGRILDSLEEMSRPFESVLIDIASLAESTFVDHFERPLRSAFDSLAPAIASFSEFLAEAFEALAPVIEPLTDAFIQILEELGPALANEVFPDLADAIINLAEAIGDNSDTFVDILTWFLQIPEALINFMAELTRIAGWFQENPTAIVAGLTLIGMALGFLVAGPFGAFVGGVLGLVFAALQFRDQMSQVFTRVKEIVLNFIAEAGRLFVRFRDGVTSRVGEIRDTVTTGFRNLRDNAIERLRRFRDGAVNIFNNLVSFVRDLPGKIASAARDMWNSLFDNFRNVVNRIIDGWNNLSFTMPSVDTFFGTLGGFTIGTPNIPRLATGGLIERAGIAEVGERGRETVFLPAGAEVVPGSRDSNMPAGVPDEFEATAVIDLGQGIMQVIKLMFRRVTKGARNGQGQAI